MQAVGARTKRGRENDERILDASLETAYTLGIDGFGLKDVAATAGLTTGALYGRYESVGELQAELWQRRLLPELRELLAATRRAIDGDFETADLDEALSPSPARAVALAAATISSRTDELGDLAPDDLRSSLAELRLLPSQATDFETGVLCLILGNQMHSQRELGAQFSGAELSPLLRSAPRTVRGTAPTPAAIAEPKFAVPDDPNGERLINALARVVARAGLHRATVRRIARAAGSSHTAVYATYGSLNGLVEHFVRVVGQSRPAPAVLAERYLNLELLSSLLSGGVQPSARTLSRLSLEFLVGVSPDPELSRTVTDFDARQYAAAGATFSRRGTLQFKAFVRHAKAVRAVNFGAFLLQETVGGMENVDFRPIAAASLAEVRG